VQKNDLANSDFQQLKEVKTPLELGGTAMMQEVVILPSGQLQVALAGSICGIEAKMIRESLFGYIDRGNCSIFVDMTKVDYVDAAGLEMLVSIQRRAGEKSGYLKVQGLHGIVKELFELTQMDKVLEIL
jgi:anti-sigma B factor antagonist